MIRLCLLLPLAAASFAVSCSQSAPAQDVPEVAQWIWAAGGSPDGQQVVARRRLTLDDAVKTARITATADNHCQVFVNGKQVASSDAWESLVAADVSKQLQVGENLIVIAAQNDGGIAALIAQLSATTVSGKVINLGTDKSWRVATGAILQASKDEWKQASLDDSRWPAAYVHGSLGQANLPWSGATGTGSIRAMLTGKLKASNQGLAAGSLEVKEGFRVDQIFSVPRSMGSWVSLTRDDRGRLIASDQGGAGMYLITPPAIDDMDAEPEVVKLPVELSSVQGMVWAFDSLYAMVNGPEPGLYRLRDTDNDGLLDAKEYLMRVPGGGEHGPHGIVLSPDGASLFVTCGNHTDLPAQVAGSRIPMNWGEDHLLPRRWDANGHAAGKLAPGGWIAKVDPSGQQWEVFSMGYRNQYDLAFNADGELFTYDADMEWDLGSPWYRPTRVCHATSGSEFGWRSNLEKRMNVATRTQRSNKAKAQLSIKLWLLLCQQL